MSEVKYTEYKSHPIMEIITWTGNDGKTSGISFGVKKAQAILEHIEEIEEFVAEHTEGG